MGTWRGKCLTEKERADHAEEAVAAAQLHDRRRWRLEGLQVLLQVPVACTIVIVIKLLNMYFILLTIIRLLVIE
jgi:hypothetical protein